MALFSPQANRRDLIIPRRVLFKGKREQKIEKLKKTQRSNTYTKLPWSLRHVLHRLHHSFTLLRLMFLNNKNI